MCDPSPPLAQGLIVTKRNSAVIRIQLDRMELFLGGLQAEAHGTSKRSVPRDAWAFECALWELLPRVNQCAHEFRIFTWGTKGVANQLWDEMALAREHSLWAPGDVTGTFRPNLTRWQMSFLRRDRRFGSARTFAKHYLQLTMEKLQ